ncbi:methyltransferase [Streptomyces sp. NPDC006739]|uniref:methyltransferase n=1 Tax=Streptomyces sp. NPDC006739 TaxID=3364763 RepID=UPI0036B3433E
MTRTTQPATVPARQDTALQAMASLATPMAIRVAATLRIADRLTDAPKTAAELAIEVKADGATLERLLRHLCALGLLRSAPTGRYLVTELAAPLRAGDPSGLCARLDLNGAEGSADLAFVNLLHAVRTGQAAFPAHYGHSFWEHLADDPALAAGFHRRMGKAVETIAEDIAAAYDWESAAHVVDVGGGNGTLLIALLDRFPRLRGTVVDVSTAAGPARQALAEAGVADRAQFVPGNFFSPLPTGKGVYVLSAILHNWNDGDARLILERCAQAAGPGGTVLVIEKIGADGESATTEEDLRMVTYFGARERGLREISALAEEASCKVSGMHAAGSYAIVELTAQT